MNLIMVLIFSNEISLDMVILIFNIPHMVTALPEQLPADADPRVTGMLTLCYKELTLP